MVVDWSHQSAVAMFHDDIAIHVHNIRKKPQNIQPTACQTVEGTDFVLLWFHDAWTLSAAVQWPLAPVMCVPIRMMYYNIRRTEISGKFHQKFDSTDLEFRPIFAWHHSKSATLRGGRFFWNWIRIFTWNFKFIELKGKSDKKYLQKVQTYEFGDKSLSISVELLEDSELFSLIPESSSFPFTVNRNKTINFNSNLLFVSFQHKKPNNR